MNNQLSWIRSSSKGLELKAGNFYIDPLVSVQKALITHGHADHARSGHKEVFATPETLAIMKLRYGNNFCLHFQHEHLKKKYKI